jgi:hypothetical protein
LVIRGTLRGKFADTCCKLPFGCLSPYYPQTNILTKVKIKGPPGESFDSLFPCVGRLKSAYTHLLPRAQSRERMAVFYIRRSQLCREQYSSTLQAVLQAGHASPLLLHRLVIQVSSGQPNTTWPVPRQHAIGQVAMTVIAWICPVQDEDAVPAPQFPLRL